jgi:ribosome-associated heat shock protein Hsp15
MRLDRWLWAARFFKTRSLACAAIRGGKIHVGGERVKPSRLVRDGDELEITRGPQSMTVIVKALHEQRRPAQEAQLLYVEIEASRRKRELEAEQRRLLKSSGLSPRQRPNKHERRQIRRFTGKA